MTAREGLASPPCLMIFFNFSSETLCTPINVRSVSRCSFNTARLGDSVICFPGSTPFRKSLIIMTAMSLALRYFTPSILATLSQKRFSTFFRRCMAVTASALPNTPPFSLATCSATSRRRSAPRLPLNCVSSSSTKSSSLPSEVSSGYSSLTLSMMGLTSLSPNSTFLISAHSSGADARFIPVHKCPYSWIGVSLLAIFGSMYIFPLYV